MTLKFLFLFDIAPCETTPRATKKINKEEHIQKTIESQEQRDIMETTLLKETLNKVCKEIEALEEDREWKKMYWPVKQAAAEQEKQYWMKKNEAEEGSLC